jgi:ERCC4-type nuclease
MEKKRKEEVIDVDEKPKKQKIESREHCMLVADNRERIAMGTEMVPLIVVLKKMRDWAPGELGTAQLPLGDFIFTQEDGIRAILERKTVRDFIASIGDKRLEEQETRLIQAKLEAPSTVVGLIIEGVLADTDLGQYNAKHIQNQIWQLSKYNLVVVTTKDLEETCKYVCYMRWSFEQDTGMADAQKTQMLSMAAYARKKKGLEPKDTYPNMLKSIPGITVVHVNAIMAEYPTITDYIRAFRKAPRLFDGLKLTDKRSIGHVLSEKMHKYTFNTDAEI